MRIVIVFLALIVSGCESLPKGTIAVGVSYSVPVGVKR